MDYEKRLENEYHAMQTRELWLEQRSEINLPREMGDILDYEEKIEHITYIKQKRNEHRGNGQ
jgi:hypothetical protein